MKLKKSIFLGSTLLMVFAFNVICVFIFSRLKENWSKPVSLLSYSDELIKE
jgi:hypothetical protein